MEISIIQPSRNNLKYLKWAYDAIRKNQGEHDVEICVADDNSNDGTWEWCQIKMKEDSNFKAIRNDAGERLGHTILYDKLIEEVATKDICIIYHADMYLAPGAISAIEKYIKPKTIVSLTRVEPPLHPDGPEKVLMGFGTEPEEFDESGFLDAYDDLVNSYRDKTTEGIFAPWAFYKQDFLDINGHDPLYRPQSKEDSDIFDRFLLNGCKFVQTWEGFVYHMTSRGSRFNPMITQVGTNSDEWNQQNIKSTRNFIRKWGRFVEHDSLMKPIVPPRYKKTLIIEPRMTDAKYFINLVSSLEPWFDSVDTQYVYHDTIKEYIKLENQNSDIDIEAKFNQERYDITVTLNPDNFNQDDYNFITQLPKIIADSGEPNAEFELGNLKIKIGEMVDLNDKLIKLEKGNYQYL